MNCRGSATVVHDGDGGRPTCGAAGNKTLAQLSLAGVDDLVE